MASTSRAGGSARRAGDARPGSTAGKAAQPTKKTAGGSSTADKPPTKTAMKTSMKTASQAATPPAAKAPLVKSSAAQTSTESTGGPAGLQVRQDETPWTTEELREVRHELEGDVARLEGEITQAESGLQDLLRDSGDGAGDDQADAGAKTFEREQEITLANNSREMLEQSRRALARIENGTYGMCESCGHPVGKMRLQAFPRATLCVSCKQRQERR